MKTKIPLLVAAALLITSFSMAQYGGGYARTHVSVQGQIVLPGVAVGYGYDNGGYGYNNGGYGYHDGREQYEDRHDRRDRDHDRYDDRYENRYDDRRDRRGDEYERFCRDHRDYRGDRRAYYRDYYGYRVAPVCGPRF